MTKRALIWEYTEEIERLQKDLNAARNNQGFYIDSDNYTRVLNEIDEKTKLIKELAEKLEVPKEENAKIEEMLKITHEELTVTNQKLDETSQKYDETTEKLSNTVNALNCTQKVVYYYSRLLKFFTYDKIIYFYFFFSLWLLLKKFILLCFRFCLKLPWREMKNNFYLLSRVKLKENSLSRHKKYIYSLKLPIQLHFLQFHFHLLIYCSFNIAVTLRC